MTWVAVAVVGGSIIGGTIASQGAQSAASTQAGAAENAQQIGLQEFNTMTGQQQPYMQSGYGAQGQLNYLLGIGQNPQAQQQAPPGMQQQQPNGAGGVGMIGGMTPSGPGARLTLGGGGDYGAAPGPRASSLSGIANGLSGGGYYSGASNPGTPPVANGSAAGGFGSLLTPFNEQNFRQLSPAYQFQMQQGQQGVLNGDASSQGALSGAAMKDLIGYNQNYANTAFNNAFNQYQTQQGNIYSRLQGVAQLGQNAAANTGQQGTALAGNIAQSAQNVGTAQAAGQIGAANAWSGAANSLSSLPLLMQMGGGNGFGATATSSGFGA